MVRLYLTIRHYHHRKRYSSSSMLSDLPSVSVCIPARNERHAMTHCLEMVLASTYPKMEVIVFDDSSTDNTSALIKSFAHEGVRFIEGDHLDTGWLGKNHALDSLLREASGTYVLFLDVDTELSPNTIGQLVAYAKSTDSSMISVLPQRSDIWRMSVLAAPLRYFWQLLLSSARHPITTSSAWMARRKTLLADFGGLSPLKAAIEPEVLLARYYAARNAYRFLISYELLGVTYQKKWSSQFETSVRLRYPKLGFSLTKSILFACLLLLLAAVPIVGLLHGDSLLISVGALMAMLGCYFMYLTVVVRGNGAFVAVWFMPIVLATDAFITVTSAIKYLLGKVTWKGRPVTKLKRETLL